MSLRTASLYSTYIIGEGPNDSLLDDALYCAQQGRPDLVHVCLQEIERRWKNTEDALKRATQQ